MLHIHVFNVSKCKDTNFFRIFAKLLRGREPQLGDERRLVPIGGNSPQVLNKYKTKVEWSVENGDGEAVNYSWRTAVRLPHRGLTPHVCLRTIKMKRDLRCSF